MNTNFIFISSIPKCQISNFSKDLGNKLDNKWSRTLYIDDPSTESVDIFIYNPTSSISHFDKGIERLNRKEDNCVQLQVFNVWFPPPNVNMASLVNEGSIMLPYLLVDCIPKHVEIHDVIGDLPFKANDFKEWDISYKDDKWIVLRLPKCPDEITRNYVLCYLRNKKLSKGILPRVTEIFISKEPRLSKNMFPKICNSLTETKSNRSNLIFIYDLPSKVSSHDITDTLRDIDYKHCKVYIVDVVDQLRLGFISTSKSMPDYKFEDLLRKLKTVSIEVGSLGKLKLNTSEVWLQPKNCEPPRVRKSDADKKVEFVLVNYIYLHNLSGSIQSSDLTSKSPLSFRVNLFHATDSKQQVGFVSLLEMNEGKVNKLIDYLRSLVFEGLQVLVDEIWIKEYDLPDVDDRRPVHISRKSSRCFEVIPNRTIEALDIIEEVNLNRQSAILCADEPPSSSNLMKSNIILLRNLPLDFNGNTDSFDLNISSGLCLMEAPREKIGFLYHRQVSDVKWMDFLEKICFSNVNGRRIIVKEIYFMVDESIDLIQAKWPGIYLSNYIFVNNIGVNGDIKLEELGQNEFIVKYVSMNADNGARCAFVQLSEDLSPFEIIEVLQSIRALKVCGKQVLAELVWLANVNVEEMSIEKQRKFV